MRHLASRHTGRRRFTQMSSRSRATRTTRAPSLRLRRRQRVIRHIAPSSRGVPLPVTGIALPGRTTQVFPSGIRRRPTALLGFLAPFAVFIPPAGGHATLASRDARLPEHTVVPRAFRRHFCRSGPTCRSCLPRPPRLIFVGVTDRLLEIIAICKSDRPGMGGFDFWASTPVCGPPPRRTFGRGDASCLGLCLLQGCRAPFAVHRPGSSPATDHPPPEHRRATLIDAGRFLSAHGLWRRSFPSRATCRRRKLLRRPGRIDYVTAKD